MGTATGVLTRQPQTDVDQQVLEAFAGAGNRIAACDVETLAGRLRDRGVTAEVHEVEAAVGRLCQKNRVGVHTDYGYFILTSAGRRDACVPLAA